MYFRYSIVVFLGLSVLMAFCSRAFDPEVRTGSHIRPVDGHPEILISAISFFDEDDQPVIDVSMDVILGSLVYRERDGIFKAEVTIQTEVYRIIDSSEDEYERIAILRESKEVESSGRGITNSRDVISHSERVRADPGRYRVIVRAIDEDSGKESVQRVNARVYDPDGATPNLTHIKVKGRDQRDHSYDMPLNTYTIPGRVDTLRFEFQVTKNPDTGPLAVNMRLIKFESDTLPPRPMSGVTPSRGSLQYRGINYNRSEELESQQRILDEETGNITIEYRTDRPSRGNYRFEVRVRSHESDDDWELFKARDFASMSSNFPNIVSVRELAKPLVYLMRRSEYRDLMEIEDRDSLKREIDRFWLSNIGNKEMAGRVIEEYYQRVEEANRQFTTFKEGWMTDMGLVYVLFGAPWYVEQSLDRVVWIYGYDRRDARRVFYFQRTRVDSDAYPFEHYVLHRHTQYHSVEYEQIQRWLTGTILTRPI